MSLYNVDMITVKRSEIIYKYIHSNDSNVIRLNAQNILKHTQQTIITFELFGYRCTSVYTQTLGTV